MKIEMMSSLEAMIAARNIDLIEKSLGRPIPGGMLDATKYSHHMLSSLEVEKEVFNIENILYMRDRTATTENKPDMISSILKGIAYAAIAYFVIGMIITAI